MGGRTTYRTLSPKRAPFQIGIDWWSHLRKGPRRWISHTCPMWLWGCNLFKISSPGPVFHGTKWLLRRPHIQSRTLYSRCGNNKGLIKRGSTTYHWRSRCKGWILWPTPYTYIQVSYKEKHAGIFSTSRSAIKRLPLFSSVDKIAQKRKRNTPIHCLQHMLPPYSLGSN
jgi:hypothetical protein